jgi:hypothetical protein
MDDVCDYQIMNLMTIDILVHGMKDVINSNMHLLTKRLLKINPLIAKL